MMPRITVVTVCLNSAATLERTIESVLTQTYPNIEYIIIDGASNDGTVDIIRRYADRLALWLSEPDRGLYDAMNKGLRHATGDVIHFLNADDHYLASDVLERLVVELEPDRVCYGQMVYHGSDGSVRRMCQPFSWSRELRGSCVPQPVTFVPLQLYREVGEFDLQYLIAADYEMFLRLVSRFPVRFIDIPVTAMYHSGLSDVRAPQAFREARKVAIRYGRSRSGAWWDYLVRIIKWHLAKRLPGALLSCLRNLPSEMRS